MSDYSQASTRTVVDAPAGDRRVIAFGNTGVGGSSGATPSTVARMALDAIAFIEALGLEQVKTFPDAAHGFLFQHHGSVIVRRKS